VKISLIFQGFLQYYLQAFGKLAGDRFEKLNAKRFSEIWRFYSSPVPCRTQRTMASRALLALASLLSCAFFLRSLRDLETM
jgi:hypothetical protein